MKATSAIGVEDVLDYRGRLGVLLETDRAFPSITGIMVREPIKGSWWAHPMANEIYLLSRGGGKSNVTDSDPSLMGVMT